MEFKFKSFNIKQRKTTFKGSVKFYNYKLGLQKEKYGINNRPYFLQGRIHKPPRLKVVRYEKYPFFVILQSLTQFSSLLH